VPTRGKADQQSAQRQLAVDRNRPPSILSLKRPFVARRRIGAVERLTIRVCALGRTSSLSTRGRPHPDTCEQESPSVSQSVRTATKCLRRTKHTQCSLSPSLLLQPLCRAVLKLEYWRLRSSLVVNRSRSRNRCLRRRGRCCGRREGAGVEVVRA